MLHKIIFKGLVLTAAVFGMSVAYAAEFKGVVGLGADFGGDLLLSGTYTDGTTWESRANQGFLVNAGVVMVTGEFETQLTAGYKAGGPQAKNGSVSYTVVPIELMEFYRAGNIRLGLGLSYHSGPKLEVNVPNYSGNGTYKFDNAVGTVFQVGWAPQDATYSIDLRVTSVKFKPLWANPAKNEYSGNVTGVYASFYF